jgi:hypothetical protein
MLSAVKPASALRTAVTAAAIAACVWAGTASASAAHHYSVHHIVHVLGLEEQHLAPFVVTYHTPDGCDVAAIMNTREQVHVYLKAGDEILTNRTQTVGIKVDFDPPRCIRRFRRGLAKLP